MPMTLDDLIDETINANPRITTQSPPAMFIVDGAVADDLKRVLEIVHMALMRLQEQEGDDAEVCTTVEAILREVGEVVVLRKMGEIE